MLTVMKVPGVSNLDIVEAILDAHMRNPEGGLKDCVVYIPDLTKLTALAQKLNRQGKDLVAEYPALNGFLTTEE